MTSGVTPSTSVLGVKRILFEIKLSFLFNANDAVEYMVPLMICATGAYLNITAPSGSVFSVLLTNVVLAWLALYMHTLSNQATGIAEDIVDKPFRPLPRRVITVRGANVRFVVVVVVFLSLALMMGVWWAGAVLVTCVVVHNYLGWDRHWLGRQIFNVAVTFTSYAMVWRVAGPIGDIGWRWILLLAAVQMVIFAQDLRDMRGDRAIGRRTVPLLIGEWPTRVLTASMLLGLAVVTALLVPVDWFTAGLGPWWIAGYGIGCAMIASHFLILRAATDDDRAYRLYQIFGHGWLVLGLFLLA